MTHRSLILRRGTMVLTLGLLVSPVFASGGMVSSFSENTQMIGRILNFTILAGGLIYLLRKPLRQFFSNRTEEILKSMQDAESARAAAEERLKEIQDRMTRLDEETEALRQKARQEVEAERDRLIRRTEEEIDQMKVQAEKDLESVKKQILQEMMQYAAHQSAEMAKQMIQHEITSDDESRLFERFVHKMGEPS